MKELALRYGTNPQQAPARVFMKSGAELPIEVLGGSPGYINLLDAVNAWQLVRELKQATGLPAATSFKHVSPSGAAVAVPLPDALRKACFVDDLELSPLACAYARARGADRLCSFGDFVALSDTVDVSTARILAREVSDGVIAPGYEPEALEMLLKKKQGKYAVVRVDPAYEPPAPLETRDVFGITFEQRRHDRARLAGRFHQHRHRAPRPARRGPARPDHRLDHAQVHPVQLGLLRDRRADDRRGRGSAVAHPLRASRRPQGRPVASAPASARPGPALQARDQARRARQRDRPVPARRRDAQRKGRLGRHLHEPAAPVGSPTRSAPGSTPSPASPAAPTPSSRSATASTAPPPPG